MQDANQLGFEIGDPVERIEQESARTFVERQRHRVDGEVAAAQVFVNGGWSDDRWFAGLLKTLGAGHTDFGASIAGKRDVDGAGVFFDGGDPGAGLFQVFLELERVSLDGKIQVPDGKTADDVADGAAGEIKIHARGAGYFLDQRDALQLIRGQPEFHGVNVISHSLSSGLEAVNSYFFGARLDGSGSLVCTGFPQVATAE